METEISYENHLCGVCSYKCINRRSLGNHIARSHRSEFLGLKDYVLKYFYKGINPLCKCGCNNEVKWHTSLNRFNEFVTGHNYKFTSTNQPNFTKDQIEKRKSSIQDAYNKNGPEIKQKISAKLKASAAAKKAINPLHYNNYFLQLWKNLESRNKLLSSRRIQWQGPQGLIRRKKVFTPAFGKKISAANCNRNMNYTSKAEKRFINYLKQVFGTNNIQSRWLNLFQRTMNPDAYLRELDVYIEFDGVYWHGLDRKTNWTFDQINHIKNDLNKNKYAREGKLNLIRISSEVAEQAIKENSIKTYEDLLALCYHVVIDKNVIKEGSFKFNDDHHPIFTREQCIRYNETSIFPNAFGKEKMESDMLPLIRTFWENYVDYWGWFYPEKNNETAELIVSKISSKINSTSEISLTLSTGTTWLKSKFRSYWNVKSGPKEAFNDQKCLDNVLKYRLGLNNSIDYSYSLSDGSVVTCKETFDINIKNIRKGFVIQRKAVSFFKPTTACSIYKRFLSDANNPKVWDPSCGFGGRALGFASLLKNKSGEYWGCEPAAETYADLLSLKSDLQTVNSNLVMNISNQGSETIMLPENYFDFVFTSPPYFDKEQYFDEPGQCWRDYPTFDEWKDSYLRKTYQNAFKSLKQGCKMMINFDDICSPISRQIAQEIGFVYLETIELCNEPDHFMKKAGKKIGKIEFFDVFQKPSA